MNRSILKIMISLLLTLAVSDYVWIEILEEQHIVAEIETEKESQFEEKEERLSESKHLPSFCSSLQFQPNQLLLQAKAKLVKHGNSFDFQPDSDEVRLFILFRQLRIHC